MIRIILVLLITVIIFHFFILFKIIPYTITWGGRLENDTQMYFFETFSILLNGLLLLILLMKGNFVKYKFSNKILNIILWLFFAIFIIGTIGNIFAITFFEKFFALITGLFALLLWKIITEKNK